MTFIRALAEDLGRDLGDLAQVNTFHGYCKHLAHSFGGVGGLTAKFDYFPGLPELVAEDLEILGYDRVGRDGLDRRIREMEEGDGILPAALEIGNYYDAVGHNDIVYRVERHFEANPESIPEHEVVVVDEYQDFNYLESRLIDSLAQASAVLIAGDDDQALLRLQGFLPALHSGPRGRGGGRTVRPAVLLALHRGRRRGGQADRGRGATARQPGRSDQAALGRRGEAPPHRGEPELAKHVAGAIAKQTGRGWRLDKAERGAQIDAVVCLAMAVERAEARQASVRLLGWL
jgi:hypothetical protein